jgi:hypothetical protein
MRTISTVFIAVISTLYFSLGAVSAPRRTADDSNGAAYQSQGGNGTTTVGLTSTATEQPTQKDDISVTFSMPVQLPNVTLAAGTYQFRTMPSAGVDNLGTHIVQVSDKDGVHRLGMFVTLPSDIGDRTDQNVLFFGDRGAGLPRAVQIWFAPRTTIGEEFVYPKTQAIQIARAAHAAVLTSEGRIDESGDVTPVETTTAGDAEVATTGAREPLATDGHHRVWALLAPAKGATAPSQSQGGVEQTTPTSRKTLFPAASRLEQFALLGGVAILGTLIVRTLHWQRRAGK